MNRQSSKRRFSSAPASPVIHSSTASPFSERTFDIQPITEIIPEHQSVASERTWDIGPPEDDARSVASDRTHSPEQTPELPSHVTVPLRLLTCECAAVGDEMKYKGFPGTVDITHTLGQDGDYAIAHHTYSSFVNNLSSDIMNKLSWGAIHRGDTAFRNESTHSDYHVNPKHFGKYEPSVDHSPASNNNVVIMLVPMNKTFAVLAGPYQWSRDKQLLDPEHQDILTEKTFERASRIGWQHYTVFVYVKQRKQPQRYSSLQSQQPTLATLPAPVRQLRASRVAAIEADMERCKLEMGGLLFG